MIPKSLVDENGELKVFTQKCSPERAGQRLTIEELDIFAKEIVKEKAESLGTDMRDAVVPGADLYMKGSGYDKDIIVRCYEEERNNYALKNLTKRINEDGHPVFPVVIYVWLWNTTERYKSTSAPNPKDRPAGGDYCVKLWYQTLLPCTDKKTSDVDSSTIVRALMDSWMNLDSSLMEPFLAYDLQYSSSEVFEVISSKEEYMYYITGKYETLRKGNLAPDVLLYRNMKTDEPAIYLKNGDLEAVLEFEIKDGLVKYMMMHPPQKSIRPEGSQPVIMGLYEFEYRLLPYLVDQCSKRQIHPLNIADKNYIIGLVEGNCDKVAWNWDDFKATVRKIDDNVLLLYWFPEPAMTPLARFAVAVVSKDGLAYYTLEFDEYKGNNTWYLCLQDTSTHHNLGQVDECRTMEEFISLIQLRILKSRNIEGTSSLGSKIKGFFKKK